MTRQRERCAEVSFSALYNSAKSDPELALLESIKEIGWQMRNIAGRERSNVASLIAAGAGLTRDTLVANAVPGQGRHVWEQLRGFWIASAFAVRASADVIVATANDVERGPFVSRKFRPAGLRPLAISPHFG